MARGCELFPFCAACAKREFADDARASRRSPGESLRRVDLSLVSASCHRCTGEHEDSEDVHERNYREGTQ